MNELQVLFAQLTTTDTGGNCVALIGETKEFGFVVATNNDGTNLPTSDDYLIIGYSSFDGWMNGEEGSLVEDYEIFG